MKYVFLKGGIVVGISADSNGIPDYDSSGPLEDFQKVDIGDDISNGIVTSGGIPSECFSKLAFMNRFTLAELGAIEASTDPIVKVLQRQQSLAEFIDIRDPKTIEGISYLVYAGLLTEQRKNEILSL